jgi:co-chaperonin GroES (HSP10)
MTEFNPAICMKSGASNCNCDAWHTSLGNGGRLHFTVSPSHTAPEALTITDDLLQRAKSIIGTKPVRAAGYRLKIFLIEADKGLDAGIDAPTLKALGFESKSEHEQARQSKGADWAIVVDVGPVAFTGEMTGDVPWVKVGQIIRMQRYSGHQYEEPAGSGKRYGLINDEDVLGVYDENVLENS